MNPKEPSRPKKIPSMPKLHEAIRLALHRITKVPLAQIDYRISGPEHQFRIHLGDSGDRRTPGTAHFAAENLRDFRMIGYSFHPRNFPNLSGRHLGVQTQGQHQDVILITNHPDRMVLRSRDLAALKAFVELVHIHTATQDFR